MCEKLYTKEDLNNFIKELLDITTIPFLIQRQIREYISERGWNYKGIARALSFMVENRNFDLRSSYMQYGIGIITSNNGEPYRSAHQYFEQLRKDKEKQEQKQQQIIAAAKQEVPIIYCGKGQINKKNKVKQIDISTL